MAAAVNSNCKPENSMNLDDSEPGGQTVENGDHFNFDVYIDEEFANIFDSESESDDSDAPNSNASNSSRILAQQLQILKESACDEVGDSPGRSASTVIIQIDATDESSMTATKEETGEGEATSETQKYCEKCHRLQTDSNSLDYGSEDGNKEDISYTERIRDSVVMDDQIIDILEDLGTCWKMLGPVLHVNAAKITNIDTDCCGSEDKANNMITIWKQQEGKYATVGSLEQALLRIKRKDIADKFLGIIGLTSTAPPPIQHIDKPLNLHIKVGLTTDLSQPDTSVLLCEDGTGRKYIVKEVTDENYDWNVEKIVDDERVLERMIIAARNSRKTREEKRQESLRRVSEELTQLRKKMRKVRIDSDSEGDDISIPKQKVKHGKPCGIKVNKMSPEEVREMLTLCEFQCESSQTMYKVLIKLIGEVGPLEGNSRCLKQLSEFTGELRAQEKKLLPKLELLRSIKEDLDEEQIVRLKRLKTWQETKKTQVDGIEKLLTSLLEQGDIKWQRVRKQSNRRSEPIFNKLSVGRGGRRRAKTDSFDSKKSFLNSTQDERDEDKKKQISLPSNARQFKMM